MSVCIASKTMDIAVDKVINWLHYHYKVNVLKVSLDSDVEFEELSLKDLGNTVIKNKYNGISYGAIKAVWLHGFIGIQKKETLVADHQLNREIQKNISNDYNNVFFSLLKSKIAELRENNGFAIGEFSFDENIKIYNLMVAQQLGFLIPDTIIATSKEEAAAFISLNSGYITKSLDTNVSIETKSLVCSGTKTKVVTSEDLEGLGEQFYASLLQNQIKKKYELRIFFYNETFFAMAIFSQNDPKTQVDFRYYNRKNPNRYVPYTPPDTLKSKLLKLTGYLKISTGSIDLIVTPDNDYVFLEINPCGQFSFVSTNCNYHIEKQLAKDLSYGTTAKGQC